MAQIVIVAESDVQGGTWAGAIGALRQKRSLYVLDTVSSSALAGNILIDLGGYPIPWPTERLAGVLSPLLQKSDVLRQEKSDAPLQPDQLLLFGASGE